jgi:hypothetical protein
MGFGEVFGWVMSKWALLRCGSVTVRLRDVVWGVRAASCSVSHSRSNLLW